MRVEELIKFLKNESQDEEVILLDEDDHKYIFQLNPPRHEGPHTFVNKNGKKYKKSVVLVRIEKYK